MPGQQPSKLIQRHLVILQHISPRRHASATRSQPGAAATQGCPFGPWIWAGGPGCDQQLPLIDSFTQPAQFAIWPLGPARPLAFKPVQATTISDAAACQAARRISRSAYLKSETLCRRGGAGLFPTMSAPCFSLAGLRLFL